MRRNREIALGALCHLFNAIPIWGLLFCGWIWFSLREESRDVVRQARNAIIFHVMLLTALMAWLLFEQLLRVLVVILPWLEPFFSIVNSWTLTLILVVYGCVCIYGFLRRLAGHEFEYPLIRHRQ